VGADNAHETEEPRGGEKRPPATKKRTRADRIYPGSGWKLRAAFLERGTPMFKNLVRGFSVDELTIDGDQAAYVCDGHYTVPCWVLAVETWEAYNGQAGTVIVETSDGRRRRVVAKSVMLDCGDSTNYFDKSRIVKRPVKYF
jgi:hypothetical protein